ncbi:MAG: hypothetical protein LQ347_005716 [Umbilicaria vellea]|nr:MAG: hypothetical protein LQ347_005716 [Umbilicaria vellea]
MHYSTLAALAVLAAPFAGAQSLSSLPTCAQAPAEAGIGATGCTLTDFKCLCSAQAFISSLTTQIQTACSPADQAATLAFAQQLCGSVGITIPTPPMASSMAMGSSMAASMAASSVAAAPASSMAMSTPSSLAALTTVAPIATQLSDGQPGVATSAAVVTQIGDGQIQAPTSGAPLATANATVVASPSPSAFVGAAAGLTAQSAALVLVGAVAVVFAL